MLPYCAACAEFFFYPRQFCPRCFSWEIEWRRCSGKGTLYTFAIQMRPQMPGFTPPYVTAIVQLDEGPRMMTNLVGVEPMPENIRCDMPVEVTGRTSRTRSRCRCSSRRRVDTSAQTHRA